jgi:hypothetical protein
MAMQNHQIVVRRLGRAVAKTNIQGFVYVGLYLPTAVRGTAGRGMLPRPQGFDLVQKSHRRQNVSYGVKYPVTRSAFTSIIYNDFNGCNKPRAFFACGTKPVKLA